MSAACQVCVLDYKKARQTPDTERTDGKVIQSKQDGVQIVKEDSSPLNRTNFGSHHNYKQDYSYYNGTL